MKGLLRLDHDAVGVGGNGRVGKDGLVHDNKFYLSDCLGDRVRLKDDQFLLNVEALTEKESFRIAS